MIWPLAAILAAVVVAYYLGWQAGAKATKNKIRSGISEIVLLQRIRLDRARRQQDCAHPYGRRAVREGRGLCLDCGAGVDHQFPDSWEEWTPG